MKRIIKKNLIPVLNFLSTKLRKHNAGQINRNRIKRILIFEGGGIGDFIKIFPVIETLNENFPNALLSIVITPAAAGLLGLFPKKNIFCEIIFYDVRNQHQSFFRKLLLLLSLRRKKYDMVFTVSRGEGMQEKEIMMFIIGASYRLGFSKDNVGNLYTHNIEFDYNRSIYQQNFDLLKESGLKVAKENIEMKIPDRDTVFAQQLLGSIKFPIVAVHPDASWNATYKAWPLEKYVALISEIIRRYKCKIVILGDNSTEKYSDLVSRYIGSSSILNMQGMTTLAQASAIIQKSDIFIGNDSGLLHIANALQIPSIAIFGSTSAEQLIAIKENCVVIRRDLACSPCYVHQYNYRPDCKNIRCLKEINVIDVVEAADRIMQNMCEEKICPGTP